MLLAREKKIVTLLIEHEDKLTTTQIATSLKVSSRTIKADIKKINEELEKHSCNRGGEKIWCTDVEDELIAFKGVKDAAVVGIPNEKYGEVAAAVVVLEKGAQLTEEQIKEEMLKEMARFKVPERILFLDAIPKTPGLKTDKKYIRTLFQ